MEADRLAEADSAVSASVLFSSAHQSALDLDLNLLRLILRRQQAAHGRTRYFRHLTMALLCWDRHAIHELPADWSSFQKIKFEAWKKAQLEYQTNLKSKRKREEECWSIRSKTHVASRQSKWEPVLKELDKLIHRTTIAWDEVESRMSYAVKSITTEVARGFFLPFLSVALGAMARIRALFLRWRLDLLTNIVPLLMHQVASLEMPSDATEQAQLRTTLATFKQSVEGKECQSQKITKQERNWQEKTTTLRRIGLAGFGSRQAPTILAPTTAPNGDDQSLDTDFRAKGRPNTPSTLSSTAKEASTNAEEDLGERLGQLPQTSRAAVHTETDANSEFVTSLQKKRKRKDKQKKKKKSKKTRKEGDFFDALFDGRET